MRSLPNKRTMKSRFLNLNPMSYFHDKAAAHLWFELAFYEQAMARVHIVFTILALKSRGTFFDNISFPVFQLLS